LMRHLPTRGKRLKGRLARDDIAHLFRS
jgi:hypothetical protein